MPRSLRWRLQLWYALVLLLVVTGFALLLYYRVSAADWRDLDAELEAAANYLDANLRRFPPHELASGPADEARPRRPPRGERGPRPEAPPEDPQRGPGPPPADRDFAPDPPFGARDPRRDPPPPRGPRLPFPGRERLLAELELPRHAPHSPEAARAREIYFGVWTNDGQMLKADGLAADETPPEPGRARSGFRPRPGRREIVMAGPSGTTILVGKSIEREAARMRGFAWQLAGGALAVLAVGLTGGWVVSSRIVRPIASISTTAAAISATNLERRLDTRDVDTELAELVGVLNAMFDRLQAAFEQLTRFTADASHELRTPLAILQSHAELALSRNRTPDEYRDTIRTCLSVCGRMSTLVDGLLLLARADAGKLDLHRQAVDLKRLVEESIALFQPLAAEKQVRLETHLAAATVEGDAGRLAQLVTNLISNGIQFNQTGGVVEVSLATRAKEVVLTVRDTGCGISPAGQAHLFERFYRVDTARARASGGNGLGLAICKCIVEAHGGQIAVQSEVGQGTTVTVHLSAAPAGSRGH